MIARLTRKFLRRLSKEGQILFKRWKNTGIIQRFWRERWRNWRKWRSLTWKMRGMWQHQTHSMLQERIKMKGQDNLIRSQGQWRDIWWDWRKIWRWCTRCHSEYDGGWGILQRFANPQQETERGLWSILLIKSDLKWCVHLSRRLFLYFNYLVSVTAGGPVSPRGHL